MSGRILAVFLAVLLMMVAGAAEPTRVVQAEEILKKIELGQPVEYNNVTIVGDLDLSGLDLPKVKVKRTWFEEYVGLPDYGFLVSAPMNISNSIIQGSVHLNESIFRSFVVFYGTKFEGSAFMLGSRFNHYTNFRSVQFDQTASFWSAQFTQIADFSDVKFNGCTDFWSAQFSQTAAFQTSQFKQTANFGSVQFSQAVNSNWAQFNQTVSFGSTQFNQTAYFDGVQFNVYTDFWNANFNQGAYFRSAQFNQTANFWSAKFKNSANFWGAQFKDAAFFWGAQFNDPAFFWSVQFKQIANFMDTRFNETVSFIGAQFEEMVDFHGAQFDQDSQFEDAKFLDVSFNNSQFSKEAFFQGAQISGTLSLYRTKYDTLNIRWSSIHDLANDDTAYHLLIQNFNKLGFTDDARECQYSYRCKHREELFRQRKFDSWLFDLLAWTTYGYGLRPVRPLGWAALFILLGGIFIFLTESVARSKESTEPPEKSPTAAGASQNKPDGNVSIYEALLLSATYFTSGASSIISATPTEFVPVGSGRYVVVLLRLLGWIFFVLFLSSLTRTV